MGKEEIKNLQRELNKQGAGLVVDGIIGSLTKAAIGKYSAPITGNPVATIVKPPSSPIDIPTGNAPYLPPIPHGESKGTYSPEEGGAYIPINLKTKQTSFLPSPPTKLPSNLPKPDRYGYYKADLQKLASGIGAGLRKAREGISTLSSKTGQTWQGISPEVKKGVIAPLALAGIAAAYAKKQPDVSSGILSGMGHYYDVKAANAKALQEQANKENLLTAEYGLKAKKAIGESGEEQVNRRITAIIEKSKIMSLDDNDVAFLEEHRKVKYPVGMPPLPVTKEERIKKHEGVVERQGKERTDISMAGLGLRKQELKRVLTKDELTNINMLSTKVNDYDTDLNAFDNDHKKYVEKVKIIEAHRKVYGNPTANKVRAMLDIQYPIEAKRNRDYWAKAKEQKQAKAPTVKETWEKRNARLNKDVAEFLGK